MAFIVSIIFKRPDPNVVVVGTAQHVVLVQYQAPHGRIVTLKDIEALACILDEREINIVMHMSA